MRRKGSLLGSIILVFWLMGASTAYAAFPGANGKIAFTKMSTGTIHVVNPDGTGETALTAGSQPAWSSNGKKIAFSSQSGVYTMNADGSGIAFLTSGNQPAWSPDGSNIVFVRSDGDSEIYRIAVDGTGATKLTDNSYPDDMPAWSPDAGKIAFVSSRPESERPEHDVWLMDPDGSNQQSLTAPWPPVGWDRDPNWSPDGSRLAYWLEDIDEPTELFDGDLHVVSRDGSTTQKLTEGNVDTGPAWSPDGHRIVYRSRPMCCSSTDALYTIDPTTSFGPRVAVVAGGTDPDWQPLYEVPRAASQLAVSLVPNFRQTISTTQCQARGGTPSSHGGPLAFSSCALPDYQAGTVAHLGAAGTASAQLTALPGDYSSANGDGADIAISVGLTDIRTAAGTDYDPSPSNPDTTLVVRLRISDTLNGSGQSDPATVFDVNFAVPFHCSATADPALGSACTATTSADSAAPGAVKEAKNTVIQSYRVRVNDVGANGSRGDPDDRTFATQGIYIP